MSCPANSPAELLITLWRVLYRRSIVRSSERRKGRKCTPRYLRNAGEAFDDRVMREEEVDEVTTIKIRRGKIMRGNKANEETVNKNNCIFYRKGRSRGETEGEQHTGKDLNEASEHAAVLPVSSLLTAVSLSILLYFSLHFTPSFPLFFLSSH